MNLRDYGLGDSTEAVRGKPRAKIVDDPEVLAQIAETGGCPHCGCETIMEVEVDVENPQLRGGKGVGTYLSCAACPWASPMRHARLEALKELKRDPELQAMVTCAMDPRDTGTTFDTLIAATESELETLRASVKQLNAELFAQHDPRKGTK